MMSAAKETLYSSRPHAESWQTARWQWSLVAVITLLAVVLRLYRLGDLGLRLDEDIFGVAVGAILDTGEPRFPSGLLYLRSALILYLTAAIAAIGGFDEYSLRLPSALFGVAIVPLSYVFMKRLHGPAIGLLVALALAIAPWELDLTRYARMYGPFAFFFLMTAYACYRGLLDGQSRWTAIALVLSPLTVSVHQLGFTAALFFVIPLIICDRERLPWLASIMGVSITAGSFFLWRDIVDAGFEVPYQLNEAQQQNLGGERVANGLIEQVIEKINLPPLDLLFTLAERIPWLFWCLSIGMAGIVGTLMWTAWQRRQWSPIFLGLLAVCCYLHQLTFGLVAFAAWLYTLRLGFRAVVVPRVWIVGGAVAGAFFAWWLFGYFFGEPNRYVLEGRSTHAIQTAKLFVSYPGYRITWLYIAARPVMGFLAFLGILFCLDRGSRGINERASLFLVLAFVAPILTNGLFESSQHFRYNFHTDAFYYGLVAIGLVSGWRVLLEMAQLLVPGLRSVPADGWLRPGFLVGASALLLMTDLRPTESWSVIDRHYGQSSRVLRQLGLPFYPDHKTAGEFVKDNLKPDDVVITMDWIQQYFYAGQSDYVIRSDFYEQWSYPVKGQREDIYIASEIVPTLQRLQEVLNLHAGTRVWLITSPRRYQGYTLVSRDIVEFIESQKDSRVYLAEDERTEVYLFAGSKQVAARGNRQ